MKDKREYLLINLQQEYPGLVGNGKWAIVSSLSETELVSRFKELEACRPFTLLDPAQWEAFRDFHRNNHKFEMRELRRHDAFEHLNGDSLTLLPGSQVENEMIARSEVRQLRDAMKKLTPTQRRRLIYYYIASLTLAEIAIIERASQQQQHPLGNKEIRISFERGLKNTLSQ